MKNKTTMQLREPKLKISEEWSKIILIFLKFSKFSIEAFSYVIMQFPLVFQKCFFCIVWLWNSLLIDYTYRNTPKIKVDKIDKSQNQFNTKNNFIWIGLWISMTRHFHAIFHRH